VDDKDRILSFLKKEGEPRTVDEVSAGLGIPAHIARDHIIELWNTQKVGRTKLFGAGESWHHVDDPPSGKPLGRPKKRPVRVKDSVPNGDATPEQRVPDSKVAPEAVRPADDDLFVRILRGAADGMSLEQLQQLSTKPYKADEARVLLTEQGYISVEKVPHATCEKCGQKLKGQMGRRKYRFLLTEKGRRMLDIKVE